MLGSLLASARFLQAPRGSHVTACGEIDLRVESSHRHLSDLWKPLPRLFPPGKTFFVAQDIVETVFKFGSESEHATALIEFPAKQVLFGAGSAGIGLLEKTTHFCRVTTALQFLEDRINIFLAHGVSPSAVRDNFRQTRGGYSLKKDRPYWPAVKRMVPASIHLIVFAGTNFWQRAPRYIPAIPPSPKRTPRGQSGATDMFG
jgi:hypothetical protein